jgi:hypothetical protein
MRCFTRSAAVFLMLAAVPASATDDKSYPAFMCLESGTETGAFNRSEYRITRTGTEGSGLLLCPFVRDNFSSGGWLGGYVPIIYAEISVLDLHYNQDVTCTLMSRRLSDGSAYYYASGSTEGSSTNVQKISIDTGYVLEGYGFLKCSVPSNDSTFGYTRLFAYKIKEATP